MDPSSITPAMRMLRSAMRVVGGRAELAEHLGVTVEDLSKWLRGEEPPPVKSAMAALDLVAYGAARFCRPPSVPQGR